MDVKSLAKLEQMGEPKTVHEERRLLRALLYGDPGAGKTTLAGQLVENKACLITADSGWVVLQKEPELAAKIHRYDFTGLRQIEAIAQAHGEGIEPWCTYDTLIWDTVSQSVNIVLRNLVSQRQYPKEQHDPEVEGRPHYRIVERALLDTVTILNKSKLNIIYTAHIRDPSQQDIDKKRFAIRPSMPEASYMVIAREVQLLGWVHKEVKGGVRQIQLEGTLKETAKCQIPTIPEATYPLSEIPELITAWKKS